MSTSYAPSTWRLLITPPALGSVNMAIDEAILHALVSGKGYPTLRFYQWDPPCLSLGYNQPYAEVNLDACDEQGFTWVRRPTGGRAILHCDELTYSVIVPDSEPRVAGGIVESYRRLSTGLLDGLRWLGADVFQAQEEKLTNPQQGAACFDTPSNYEITVDGKKLIGSAQVRRRGIVLQHGTLPLIGDLDRIFGCLRRSPAQKKVDDTRRKEVGAAIDSPPLQSLGSHAVTLEQALGHEVTFEEAAEALKRGFIQALNLTLEPGDLTDFERSLVENLRQSQYENDDWNRRV